ncbi:MAG TPA: glycosyltransferase, partial [Bacteroidia bacterium]
LHEGLLSSGINSKLLCLTHPYKQFANAFEYTAPVPNRSERIKNKAKRILHEFYLRPGIKSKESKLLENKIEGFDIFSFPDSPFNLTQHPLYKEADVINLHWTAGFLDYPSFFKDNKKIIVWTLHDMNPFTGGCHYSSGCEKFKNNCRNCPQLQGTINPDLSSEILNIKINSINPNLNLTIVSLSEWMMNLSRESLLFRNFTHTLIVNGVNTNVFKPLDVGHSRKLLSLPMDKKIILFIAQNLNSKRKGFQFLLNALDGLSERKDTVLCVVGNHQIKIAAKNVIDLGIINEDRLLSAVYSASDLFIIPSVEDNLPNTVVESLLCGTPVVGFHVGGIPDLIQNGKNGFLTKDISSEQLLKSINDFLDVSSSFDRRMISEEARSKYSIDKQVKEYISLYQRLLSA